MTLGERIQYAREKKGMRKVDLARALGVTYDRIRQWEKGIRNPKVDILKNIADVTGVSVLFLIGEEEADKMAKEKSVVVSVRVSDKVYDMLKYLTVSRREHAKLWLVEHGPVYGVGPDITESLVAKELLVNAIGVAYAEEKNVS